MRETLVDALWVDIPDRPQKRGDSEGKAGGRAKDSTRIGLMGFCEKSIGNVRYFLVEKKRKNSTHCPRGRTKSLTLNKNVLKRKAIMTHPQCRLRGARHNNNCCLLPFGPLPNHLNFLLPGPWRRIRRSSLSAPRCSSLLRPG